MTSSATTDFFQQSLTLTSSAQENLAGNDFSKIFSNPFSSASTHPISTLAIEPSFLQQPPGNGYQKLPAYCPPALLHTMIENDAVDNSLALKLNRMLHTQSPQLPRKIYEPTPSNVPFLGNQSPYMQQKFQPDEGDYNPYKPLPQPPSSTFSPVIRKRYQEGHLVSEDLEFRILHGNTSPIVLQRFYHQQNQFKDQKKEADELRAIRLQSASPNPFKNTQSSIPVKSSSPLPQRYQQHQIPRGNMQNFDHLPTTFNATSQRIYESHIPQLQSRTISNGNGTIQNHYRHQPMYDNVRAQIPCPGSPQLDRLRANLEKPNFYERHQKLPVEIESSYQQMEANRNQSTGINSEKNKDKGER